MLTPQSYCPKHTAMRKSPTKHQYHSPHHSREEMGGTTSEGGEGEGEGAENRPSQLVQLQEQFYNYASIDDLIEKLKLSPKLSSLIYNYWKLKRKVYLNSADILLRGCW